MAAALLNCSICPKKPTFSDTSHLLTHVSSKGHLSNLHKLQVRSHQESGATHQLAGYSQWYQHHDLGRLLSERLLQKESKKATKRQRSITSPKNVKKEVLDMGNAVSDSQSFAVDPRLEETPSTRRRKRSNLATGSIPRRDDGGVFDSSPIKQRTKRKAHLNQLGLIKRSEPNTLYEVPGSDDAAEIDPAILDLSDSSKLKGVLWPGMHLFDAATADMRRRRNQKKDSSVLMQMEKTSQNVQPTEVIYSDGWTSVKRRLITGMVDDSSPLKGESPLPKKPVRRKRIVLAEVSANAPRKVNEPLKLERSQPTNCRSVYGRSPDRHSPSLLSSSNSNPYVAETRFSPTEDETMEFKLTVRDFTKKKKRGNFRIFQDKETTNSHDFEATTKQRETDYPHLATQVQSHLFPARPHVPLTTSFALQSQNQQNETYQNLYLMTGLNNPSYYTSQPLEPIKDNFEPWFTRTGQVEHHARPSCWSNTATIAPNPYQAYDNSSYDGHISFSGLPLQDDVFGYSTNPLSATYQNLQEHAESPFKTSESACPPALPFKAQKDDLSPDGTISEHSGYDYGESIFTVSE